MTLSTMSGQRDEDAATFHQPVRTKFGTINAVWEMDSEAARRRAIYNRAKKGATRTLGRRDVIVIEPTPAPVVAAYVIPPGTQPWRRIVIETALKHQMTPTEMLSKQRTMRLVIARHECMYRLKTETTMSLPAIGRRLGKDHTTILHGVKKHIARMEKADAPSE